MIVGQLPLFGKLLTGRCLVLIEKILGSEDEPEVGE